jgi:enamine deaminase RidA (YjgF/YER057c/UK114 family)
MASEIQVARLARNGLAEFFVTVSGVNDGMPSGMFGRLEGFMQANPGARILKKDILGCIDFDAVPAPSYRGNGSKWPVTRVRQGECKGAAVAGLLVHAVEGVPTETIMMDGRPVGSVFEDEHARYCILGDIRASDTSAHRDEQARQTFIMMEEALRKVGMDFSNTVRTWLYIHDILDWYDDFNVVRSAFFKERDVFSRMVPASTGVGGANPAGAALVANLYAVEKKSDKVRIEALPSPLQCPALDYGSSFSRAVEVATPGVRRILVSGTASIEPGGATAHVDDVDAQLDLTMDVVYAILESRGMGWNDVTRAIAYFKECEDAPAWDKYCARKKLPTMPVVVAQNHICRDDLLFEIEVDAAVLE